ncbi:MAG: hypothetical protein U1E87_10095 [Alphaproteobacteria bacterium]
MSRLETLLSAVPPKKPARIASTSSGLEIVREALDEARPHQFQGPKPCG